MTKVAANKPKTFIILEVWYSNHLAAPFNNQRCRFFHSPPFGPRWLLKGVSSMSERVTRETVDYLHYGDLLYFRTSEHTFWKIVLIQRNAEHRVVEVICQNAGHNTESNKSRRKTLNRYTLTTNWSRKGGFDIPEVEIGRLHETLRNKDEQIALCIETIKAYRKALQGILTCSELDKAAQLLNLTETTRGLLPPER